MKKILLFSAIAGMITFYSCKKDDKTVTVTNTVHDTITNTVTVFASGMINADSLATNITLAHSTKVADATFPVASTDADAPVLDSSYSKNYKVIRSRYLTVYPPNVSGYVAGYYVQIVGAKSYFKVDFPAMAVRKRAARQAKLARLSNGRQIIEHNSGRGTGEGNIDSTLLFKLPASVHGDTFYIKYAAYDLSNRVSNPITAMVVLLPENNETSTTALTGTWDYVSYRNYDNGKFDRDWKIDTAQSYPSFYYCEGDVLYTTSDTTDYYLEQSHYGNTWKYTLGKQSLVQSYRQYYRYLDTENSSCSNLVFSIGYENKDEYNGAYLYDPASKKITFIIDGNTNVDLDSDTYYLSELTNTTMILSELGENPDDNYKSLYKFVKQ